MLYAFKFYVVHKNECKQFLYRLENIRYDTVSVIFFAFLAFFFGILSIQYLQILNGSNHN